jgi:putative membrane-bound dehydrogenase-like protein
MAAGGMAMFAEPIANPGDANPSGSSREDWMVQPEGPLKVASKVYGQMRSKAVYGDFHLVLEYKWTDKTAGPRETKARRAAIVVDAGAETPATGVGVLLQEGRLGDIGVVGRPQTEHAQKVPVFESELLANASGERFWASGKPRQQVMDGFVHWLKHDPKWLDRKGFRGVDDLESPIGEWNRLEVLVSQGTLQCIANGVKVNEARGIAAAQRHVALNVTGAELVVRRFELHPPGTFRETWSAIQASGGTDVSVRDGQTRPMSVEESLAQVHLDGPYEAQIVAAEPLVLDPVECAWDAGGRLYVADMRDYPLGPRNAGDPWLSRIQLLRDEDGDGRMDKAVTFADHLDHVQGLLPYKDGLIVTTRTQILFLKDTNGDGVADEIRPLINGFNPRFSQLQVSAPRWGPDGCVYFNNGLDAKEIYSADQPEAPVGVPRSNFRWDPRSGKLEAVTGFGQYGAAFDDFGRYFFCSNRNPVMFAVMPLHGVQRNPLAMIEKGWDDIAPSGPDTRVFPVRITHTTADAHAGTNTACSGLGVYRGHLMPELKNNVFVPEPTGQLVTRYKIENEGASLKAVRVGEHTEFFRSGD